MKRTVVRVVLATIAVVLIALLVVGAYLGWIMSQMPPGQGARLEVVDRAVGVETGGSYVWIVRTPNGAMLVDSGVDAEAVAITTELAAMGLTAGDVHTILLTHAHFDHVGGLAHFPQASVVHGPGEGPLLRGEGAKLGWIPAAIGSMMPHAILPANVSEAADGQVLDVDGLRVLVVSTPGHTLGSATYVLGDLVFAGDTLVSNKGAVQVLPGAVTSDVDALARSVHRFGPLDAVWMADGHGGLTPKADAAIEAFLAKQPKP